MLSPVSSATRLFTVSNTIAERTMPPRIKAPELIHGEVL
jgi:hypothetical protein